jgi:hypothetical protein
MTSARTSRVWCTIPLIITIFSLSLPAYAQYSGGTGEPNDPYQIATAEDLMLLGDSPEDYDKHFVLTADIDLAPNLPGRKVFDRAVIAPDTDPNDEYSQFQGTAFAGVFDGCGHSVSQLRIVGGDYVGLFGQLASGAEVKNVGVVGVDIAGSGHYVGGLAGNIEGGGGLTGCYSSGAVSGISSVGGLVGASGNWGHLGWDTQGGIMTRCHSSGSVTGNRLVGGLVGENWADIGRSHSTAVVNGDDSVGGLVGWNYGRVIQCRSMSAVSGGNSVGGLVGYNYVRPGHRAGAVTDCYSGGEVSGHSFVGGLVGVNGGHVAYCYSTGAVIGGAEGAGGLVGYDSVGFGGDMGFEVSGTVTGGIWDVQTSRQAQSAGGTGKTTAKMQTAATFVDAGWDFVDETANGTEDIWWIDEGNDYPRLWWELIPEN